MLEFPSHDSIEVYASDAGFICFKSGGELEFSEQQIVCLTIGQFRSVIKNANELIEQANWAKENPAENNPVKGAQNEANA